MTRPRYKYSGAEQFIKDTLIKTNALESCDVEVCADAMSKYILFYPYYNDSKLLFTGSRCVLDNGKLLLDADIITSGRSLEKKNLDKKMMDAFEEICYSIGNMMPVIGNCKAGTADNWAYKMNRFSEYFNNDNQNLNEDIFKKYQNGDVSFRNTSQLDLWPVWVKKYWRDKNEFIRANFLMDIFPNDVNIKIDKIDEQFMINTIKIIIQRSYRILFNRSGKFTPRDERIILEILRYFSDKYTIDLGDTLFGEKRNVY